MRLHTRGLALAWPLALFAAPLVLALPLALVEGSQLAAWRVLLADASSLRLLATSTALSVATALASTLAALVLALWLTTHLHGTRAWQQLTRSLGGLLAVPHAAFAIGLTLLVMPAGLLARALAPLAGWAAPPDWPTVNDPWGLGLVAVLVAKETPFVLWNIAALLARPDLALQLRGWLAEGRTLGYAPRAIWWRVLWPLLLPRLAWPLLAVLAYGLTVVDLALIVGPASPPTLALLAWQNLSDGDVARNAQGAAMALLLGAVLLLLALALALAARGLASIWQARVARGRRTSVGAGLGARAAPVAATALLALYAVVALLLVASSVTGVWTFPSLLPQSWALRAWSVVATSVDEVALTAGLALVASTVSLLLVVAWFEAAPPAWDRRAMPLVLAPLVVPGLALMVGLYHLALPLRLDGTLAGLAWVHLLVTLPYVFVALAPAWRSFDRRYEQTARALGRSLLAYWWHVKWPLLRAPIAAALAVGFAVSVAQYLATQFIGAGRFATVTTEAVTLASGGQRHTAAAFAVLQALLPLLGFALAARVARRAENAAIR